MLKNLRLFFLLYLIYLYRLWDIKLCAWQLDSSFADPVGFLLSPAKEKPCSAYCPDLLSFVKTFRFFFSLISNISFMHLKYCSPIHSFIFFLSCWIIFVYTETFTVDLWICYSLRSLRWDVAKGRVWCGVPERVHSGQVQKLPSLRKRQLSWHRIDYRSSLASAMGGRSFGICTPGPGTLVFFFSLDAILSDKATIELHTAHWVAHCPRQLAAK